MNSNDYVINNYFDEYIDLSDQIKALQVALAVERGENNKFREEVRTLLRSRGDQSVHRI